jgi:hypothetical protein
VRPPRPALAGLLLLGPLLGSVTAPAARAEDDTAARVTVSLENLDGPKAKMSVEGAVSYLPDGTLLHISLTVDGRHPPVEAGFFRVTVQGGRYGGAHDWRRRTFAPLAYRTEVRLIMEVQNPAVKRFLSRELGYRADHVEVISVAQNVIGTEEERSAFQVQTLRTLRGFQQRIARMQAEVSEKVQLSAEDPAFVAFEPDFLARLRGVRDDLRTLDRTRVVWYDAAVFQALGHTIFQLDWNVQKHKEADPGVVAQVANAADDLRRILDDIDSRLPAEGPR